MNILIIGRLYPDTFSKHIYDTLISMNHTVYIYQPGLKTKYSNSNLIKGILLLRQTLYDVSSKSSFFRENELKNLKKFISTKKIDLTISVHDFLTPDQVTIIKNITKSPVVIWFPDALINFRKAMFLNAEYDFLFFKDPYVVEYVKNVLLMNAFYLPECCNPEYHKPVEMTEKELDFYSCDITTAGNLNSNRSAFFSNLNKYNVKLWGNPAPLWMDISKINKMIMNKYVSENEKAKAFGAAKIVLNNLHPGEIWGINCRAFEIPACGAFQIINDRPTIAELFDLDKEIVTFKHFDELVEKLDYYLENDAERKSVANAGKERAHKDHTYLKRLELMFNTIFGNEKGFEYSAHNNLD